MHITRVLVIFFSFCLITPNSFSQISQTYFQDTLPREEGKVTTHIKDGDYIIYGGQSFDQFRSQPSVTKIDTLGNTIWTTTTQDTSKYSSTANVFIDHLMQSGDFIYASFFKRLNYEEYGEIWKIDASSGKIIWKAPFINQNTIWSFTHMIDYDETRFIVGFFGYDPVDGERCQMAFIDKNDGQILSTTVLGEFKERNFLFGLGLDKEKKLYYSDLDSIVKIDPLFPDDEIWRISYADSRVLDFNHIYTDETEDIYLTARTTSLSAKVLKINSVTGDVIWDVSAVGSTGLFVTQQDMIDKDGFIYISWAPKIGASGGGNSFRSTKINKETGEIIWSSAFNFNGENSWAGVNSIDIDDNGDLYLAGTYLKRINVSSQNRLGLLKISGIDGKHIYDQTISLNTALMYFESQSEGVSACVINNKPYFLGKLQNRFLPTNRTKTVLIELDNITGEVKQEKTISGRYKFPSRTIQIKDYGDTETAVLKQLGRHTLVERYDTENNLVWGKIIEKEYMLNAGILHISDEGNIFVSCTSAQSSEVLPYFKSETDSIYLFELDPQGNLINECNFPISGSIDVSFPLQIVTNEGQEPLLIYNRSTTKFFNCGSDGANPSTSNLSSLAKNTSQTNYVLEDTDTSFIFIVRNNISFRKISEGRNIDSYRLEEAENFNFIDKGGNEKVLVCGVDENGMDLLSQFDKVTYEFDWVKTYDENSEMLKFVYNSDSSSVYTLGTINNETIVRNISTQTGEELWSTRYNGGLGLKEIPSDIEIDAPNNRIIVTGHTEIDISSSEVFILEMSTDGSITNTYLPESMGVGNNKGICVHVLNNGSIWVGGEIIHPDSISSGFIFELESDQTLPESYIRGITYFDENQNGIKDVNEQNLQLTKVELQPNENIQFTDAQGFYTFYPAPGDYTLSAESIPNWELSSDSSSYQIKIQDGTVLENLDFGFTPISNFNDGRATISSGITRCFRSVDYYLDFKNEGTTILNGFLSLKIDDETSVAEFIDQPSTIVDEHNIQWTFENLYPGEIIQKRLVINMPSFETDSIEFRLLAVGLNENNNQSIIDELIEKQEIVCAYDPNDKAVSPNRDVDENYTTFDEELIYTIRFQNTGNDTAFTVIVRDTLSDNLDPTSLKVLSCSHMDLLRTSISEQKYLAFTFENIMLPDSTENFNGSQGYVSFTINTKDNIDEFTPITNSASIYFDFNPPILTNTVINTLVSTLDADEDGYYFWLDCDDLNEEINPGEIEIPNNEIDEDCDGEDLVSSNDYLNDSPINIYPSPFSNELVIEAAGVQNGLIKIITVTGQEVYSSNLLEYNKIDLQWCTNGVYIIQISSGQDLQVKRIIKQSFK